MADAGSPRKSAPILSISSIISSGLFEPASRMARMIVPGIAPMYVRRWPRISDSSRTPPTEMRSNARPSERAIDLPSDVLPTPGGPAAGRLAQGRLARAGRADEAHDRAARVRLELAHREELEDAVLDLLDVVVVGVEYLAGVVEVEG